MKKIPLTQGMEALVDDEDYEKLSKHKWYAQWRRYTFVAAYIEKKTRRTVLMHREVINAPPGAEVDHADGDGLNNQRMNLRLASASQNRWNSGSHRRSSSRYKGVNYDSSRGKWLARICKGYQQKNIGRFDSEEEAARAYDKKAKELFGDFARLNFPNDKPTA